ncbi:MAG TPA: transglutaminase domain-containing protein [Kofleriaceae bacterium]|nr:transglutaminase domain-containing protein [Kofleriaceae bacterium]
MRVRCSTAAVLLSACAGRSAAPVVEREADPVEAVVRPARVAWALTWRGQAIGGAWERDTAEHFERRERIVVRRGDDVVISDLAITIERDDQGAPYQVGVTRWQDGPVLDGTAMRSVDGGWLVEIEGEQPAALPAAAPFELVLREGREFHGDVLLAGWGFATAHLDLSPSAGDPQDRTARLFVGGRRLEATVTYDADGAVAAVVGGDGITATRAAFDADLRPAQPPEVVDGNAITVDTRGAAGRAHTLALLDATAPPPPALPGQRPLSGQPTWVVALDPVAPGALAPELRTRDRSDEVAALVHRVSREIADDLASTATTTGAALTATHGDCTTHALRFAALADEAGITARVVTGLRLDDGVLVRHRWNVAWTGSRWVTIDPTFDEAPATPALVGLAVHGARAADLAAADATVFDGLGTRAELR